MEQQELGILDLLKIRGLDVTVKAKMLRHQDKRFDVGQLIRDGWLEVYQGHQAKPRLKGCDYFLAFKGDGGTRARFIGVYRILKERKSTKKDMPKGCPLAKFSNSWEYYYEHELDERFADLEGRIVIEWGPGTLAWAQHLKNKPILEIYPPGRVLAPFTDYMDFILSYQELQDLMKNPGAHRDWKSSLSGVAGVYLIWCEATGQQYIGSAYGSDGIWGRWEQYAKKAHGGNKLLRKLLKENPDAAESFRFSILQVLPKTTKNSEIIRWETQYKRKLGTIAIGLNAN